MYTNPLQANPNAAQLRKQAGRYIRQCRDEAGLTQQNVAKAIGLDYYTMVSQVELGKTRVPPEKMRLWAEALKVEPRSFAKRLLQYYDPYMWQLLFADEH